MNVDAVDLQAFGIAGIQRPAVEALPPIGGNPLVADPDAAAAVTDPALVSRIGTPAQHVSVAVLEA